MISIGPKYVKLKVSLQSACNHLNLLQIKQSETSEKLKIEVADCIKNKKCLIVRIKAHEILKCNAIVKAMEIVERCCEQILDRYELFQKRKQPDVSLVVPVSSLIWVSPYFESDIKELEVISKQLAVKYGSLFFRHAATNHHGKVNQDLIEKIVLTLPCGDKIDNCLLNICIEYGLPFGENLDILPKPYKPEEGQSESKSSCANSGNDEQSKEDLSMERPSSRTSKKMLTNRVTYSEISESFSNQKQALEEEENSIVIPGSTFPAKKVLSLDHTDKIEGNDNQFIDVPIPEDNLDVLSCHDFLYVSMTKQRKYKSFNNEKCNRNDNNVDQDSASFLQLQNYNGFNVIYSDPSSPSTTPQPSYTPVYKENSRRKEERKHFLSRSESQLQFPACPS